MLGGVLVICIIVWIVQSNRASARPSTDALGPNPEIRESIELAQSPELVYPGLIGAYDHKHTAERNSAPDAILFRRGPDVSSYGYAFLVRLKPSNTGGTTLLLSGAPLNKWQKKIPKRHWEKFTKFVRTNLPQ